ncbi:hypothetical protein RRG08_047848 [Elysia crispata]|uniref:Uncharacterized protein n=1 Tax=Elysia crispata TaxID=231223 RepID=A0AAE0ZXQ0_9GAST|nr:hypothetical protein RRG08_047848 [Elysia crispata]
MPKMRRPYSAMAANQLSTDLFRPPLARTGSSSIGHQLPRSTLSVDARSSQELPSEESLRDGTVGPARSNRSGFLASSPAGHALRKQRRPLSASTISSAFPSFTAWKTPDTPPFPFQHKQEQHHHQQEQPQHPSSPPPPQRHPPQSPSPEPDVPQGDTTSLSSSTEVAHTGVRWSLGRQSQLLYAFKIAALLVVVCSLILVKIAFIIGKNAAALYKIVVRVTTIVAVHVVAVLRYSHLAWRCKLITVLSMADRFEKRTLKQSKRSGSLPSPRAYPAVNSLSRDILQAKEPTCGDSTTLADRVCFNLEEPQQRKGQMPLTTTQRSKTFIFPVLNRQESTISACDK